jgi:hypothetical protein
VALVEKPSHATQRRPVKRIHPFAWGHVLGAFAVGIVSGAFLDLTAVATFSSVLAANAIISSLICWWRPGFEAAGWKLWLMATFVNPLMLSAIAFSIDQYECLVGQKTGWSCLLSDAGPMVVAACLPSPLIGLAVRLVVRWRKRRAATA